MNTKIKIIFVSGFFILVAVGAGLYFWQDWQNSQNSNDLEAKPPSGEFQEYPLKNNFKNQMPDLSRVIPKNASNENVEQIKFIIQALKDNNDYFQGWLQLGILRKNVGDWDGALEAWKFTAVIRPDNSIAYLNLGDLYGYYFHDNQKAEENLLKAIEVEPVNIYGYFKTYEFYTDTNQPEKARQIIKQGITANPNTSQQLQSILHR